MVFNYGMNEVASFLMSSAMFWIEKYHVDGLRVDAVASMLYLDYNRRDGEWEQNVKGGKENLEAIAFLQKLNTAVLTRHPHKMMIAEESTAWPLVTKPAADGGLGFNFKWNMGWMNDMLSYMKTDPLFRAGKPRQGDLQLLLCLQREFCAAHQPRRGGARQVQPHQQDARRLRGKVRQLAHLLWLHDGPSRQEAALHGAGVRPVHRVGTRRSSWTGCCWATTSTGQLQSYVKDLNHFYRDTPAMWQVDYSWEGFQWIVPDDNQQSVIAFLRRDAEGKMIMIVCNFNPVLRENYEMGRAQSRQLQGDPQLG